jgi:hypothetical protein
VEETEEIIDLPQPNAEGHPRRKNHRTIQKRTERKTKKTQNHKTGKKAEKQLAAKNPKYSPIEEIPENN